MDKPSIPITDGPWPYGVDSVSDPLSVPPGHARWAVNALNKGAAWKTRPGYAIRFDSGVSANQEPRGLEMFYPKNGTPTLVKAVSDRLRIAPYPFDEWIELPFAFPIAPGSSPVYMTQCIMGAETQPDGSLKLLNSYPVMIIQDGLSRAKSWDGSQLIVLNPDPDGEGSGSILLATPNEFAQTPIGRFGIWVGNRYWVAQGNRLYASNFLEPIKFTETLGIAEGGYFTLPDVITGMGKTADEKTLVVFTATTTSTFQINLPRNVWTATPGFQTEILPNIGCVAHRSIINMYGMLWWYSRGGWINLDAALSSYRSSRIHYKDNNMMRSKANMADDKSGICAGSFDNYTTVSVPSGDLSNAHTWVMDQMPNEADNEQGNPVWSGIWTGIRPVQWVTAEVGGKSRCFVLSRDRLPNSATSITAQVWEVFTKSPVDIGVDILGDEADTFSPIPVSIETRYLTESTKMMKTYFYIRALVSGLRDTCQHVWSYASRHGVFLEVQNKQTQATIGAVDGRAVNVGNVGQRFYEQVRELKSTENQARQADGDTAKVESEHTRNKDRGFFLLLNWTGVACYEEVTLFCNLRDEEPRGKIEPDEETDRSVNQAGVTAIAATTPVDPTILLKTRESEYVRTSNTRVQEVEYSVLV